MLSSADLRAALTPRLNKYIFHTPHPMQAAMLLASTQCDEILFGGAAGGGKSDALLQAALQYADLPNYNAVIFRRTYPQLAAADGMIPRSREWLAGTDAKWSEKNSRWTFPSGATLSFRHMQYEKDKYDHQGARYDFVGWDELTHFTEGQYTYLQSRVRRSVDSVIPLRSVGTSNPGGAGHTWVKRRFLVESEPGRLFIPSRLEDNPSLDQEDYDKKLRKLGGVDYERLRHGNWDIEQGAIFDRNWFKVVANAPKGLSWLRSWDLATTEKTTGDWSRGAKVAFDEDGNLWIGDMASIRAAWPAVERKIAEVAHLDGVDVEIGIETIASWKIAIQRLETLAELRRHTLRQLNHLSGDKVARCGPWAAKAERGKVYLVEGPWVSDFLDECVAFPDGKKDQIDAVSNGVTLLGRRAAPRKRGQMSAFARRRRR